MPDECEVISESQIEWLSEATVDRESRVIRNACLCGNSSANGYSIPSEAFGDDNNVKALYEESPVFIDHLPPEKRKDLSQLTNRSLRDFAGTIKDSRKVAGKPRGDIHCNSGANGDLLLDLADKKTPKVGFSHIAMCRWNRNRTAVEQVMKVHMVDAVMFPATVSNFSEQHDHSNNPKAGELQMAEQTNNTAIELLQEQNTALKEVEVTQKAKIADLESQIAAEQKKVADLTAERDTLLTEQKELKIEVEKFQTKDLLAERRSVISKELKDAKLNETDETLVSKLFIEQLMSEPDEAKRSELIKDRAVLCEQAGSGGGGGNIGGTQRRGDGGGNSGEYSPEKDLEKLTFV